MAVNCAVADARGARDAREAEAHLYMLSVDWDAMSNEFKEEHRLGRA